MVENTGRPTSEVLYNVACKVSNQDLDLQTTRSNKVYDNPVLMNLHFINDFSDINCYAIFQSYKKLQDSIIPHIDDDVPDIFWDLKKDA